MLRGDRLRRLRQQKDYTHEELAEMLGVSVRMIARYEGGVTDPTSEKVTQIAQVFGVTTDYLLGATNDPDPNLKFDDLTPTEKRVLSAMRQGEVVEAIKVILSEV